MSTIYPWVQRKFDLNYPAEKFYDLLERLRGTPARTEDLVKDLTQEQLITKVDDGWTIQQNIGHLIDLGYLPRTRLMQILAGETELIPADMTNRQTNEANHNERKIADLLADFRTERMELVAEFEKLGPEEWGKSARHPRINQQMRIVDIVYFDSEHDDYHLARISALRRRLLA